MPLQVGITGGIGAGKSIVCRIFEKLGISTYDADSRAKYLMTTDGILISLIKKEFGELSYGPEGELNRKYIAELAFKDPSRLSVLNALVHPRVAADYETWVRQHQDSRYVIKEAALLFESNSYKSLDQTIVVTAPRGIRLKRVLLRDPHRNEADVYAIMDKQMSEEKKVEMADHVILNDEEHLVIPQVLHLHQLFSA